MKAPQICSGKELSALIKIRYIFQDDTDLRTCDRFKPCILTDEGIEYLGFTIELTPAQWQSLTKTGAVTTSYGLFSFDKISFHDYWSRTFGSTGSKTLDSTLTLVIQACAVLDLPYPHSKEDLKAAYRKQSKLNHPDAGGDSERFIAVTEAYEVLQERLLQLDHPL